MNQRLRAEKLERLRALIREGIESGSAPLARDEIERVKQEGRSIRAARGAVD
jgi:hypothetical protein